MAIRNWGGSIRATPRTPRSCDGPRGSLSMRPLGLAGQRSLQAPGAARACVARIDRRVTGEQQVCLRTTRWHAATSEGEHGWRGLARSGRVVGPREGNGSLIDARLVALASMTLGGSCHCKWASTRVSGRREEAKGGTRRRWDTAFTWCVWETLGASADKASLFSWRLRAGRFVGSVTWRRGGPPAHRPSGRGPGCGFTSDHAIPTPSQAGGAFV